MNGLTPDYLRAPIPPTRHHLFGNRPNNVIRNIFCRNDRFLNSFFPNSIEIWNHLGPELRGSKTLSIFKNQLLKIFRPIKREVFGIHDHEGVKRLYQLRLGLSPLKKHKKSHNFIDTPNDLCECRQHSETTQHYLLQCNNYIDQRRVLLDSLNPLIEANNIRFVDDKSLILLLLYGNKASNDSIILYIKNSVRFSSDN